MPLKKKKYNARFPAGRIKKIMQTDEEVGKVAQAVPVIISRTLEMFVESLLTKSLQVTLSRNAKTLSPSHLKQCILAEQRFDFLRDLVKSIPDVSPAEEKEGTQNWSAENSPNSCRYDVKKPKLSSYPSVASQNNSAHSSDSSSDCEVSKSKLGSFGNGKYTKIKTENKMETKTEVTSDEDVNVAPYPVPNCNVVPSNSKPSIIVQPQHVSLTVPTSSNRPSLNRPTNFYQETLRDVDEKRDSPPVHSSVIQLNPEYSRVFSTKLKNTTEQPKLLLDLSKGLPSDLNILGSSKPVFHFDLSSVPLTPGSSDGLGPPFTPSLLRQPQTPLLFDERNISKTSSDSYYKNMLHRSESFTQTRKEPPPLQTLKRAASFDNSRTSTKPKSTSDSANLPQIKIDIANDGHSPMYHLDLSNFKFDASSSSPSPVTPKKRKFTPNEPPGLLPINPTQRPPINLSKNSVASMQLDEDYDT